MKNKDMSLDDFAAWELEAYADGEALPHVAAFFEDQPAAWQTWRQEQQATTALKTKLHRFDCPLPERLLAYHWQELAAAEQQQLEAHLQLCMDCALELKQLQAFLQPEPSTVPSSAPLPATQVTQPRQTAQTDQRTRLRDQLQALSQQLHLVVATLVQPTMPHFAGVALRSDPTPVLQGSRQTNLLFEAGEAAVSLILQEDPTGALRLAGQLLTAAPTAEGMSKLSAAHPSDSVIQTPIDDTGNFVIESLQPGAYQLVLTLGDQAIVVPNLQLT